MADLETILSGQDPEPVSEQPRGEDGRWLPASEVESAPPAETPPETTPEPVQAEAPPPKEAEDRVPQAALLDERRKRQAYERELQELREEVNRLKAPKAEPPEDFWTNPEAHLSAAEKRAIAVAEAKMAEMVEHMNANLSERLARRQYQDYDQKREFLMTRMESDPVLKSELSRHLSDGGDLGEFVYSTATRLQELAEVKDIAAYRERIRAEERAKVEAEMRRVPQSLNTIPSPAATTETWSGPPPLAEILRR